MLVVSFLQWWYSRGWYNFAQEVLEKLHNLADFFSLGLLLRTFFSPFRQISAYTSDNASLQQSIAEFFDKLLSRIIGAVVRFFIIIFGIVAMLAVAVIGVALICIWPMMPFAPIAGIVLAMMGVTL